MSLWDQSQRAISNVWDQIITNLNAQFIWSQISEKSLWDQSQHSLLMCGTSPSLNCWHLGLVPERHFLCLGPDNDPHYVVPNIKNVSMGPVPDINNGDWDWSQRAVFGIWDWSQSIIGTTNYNVHHKAFSCTLLTLHIIYKRVVESDSNVTSPSSCKGNTNRNNKTGNTGKRAKHEENWKFCKSLSQFLFWRLKAV